MAKHKLTPEQLVSVKELAKQWGKIVARRVYGECGPDLDVDFDQMEQTRLPPAPGWSRAHSNSSPAPRFKRFPTSYPVPPARRSARSKRDHANWSRGATLTLQAPVAHCPACRRDFFPQRTQLKLDAHGYSPSVLAKIFHAGAVLPSFELASKTLRLLADVPISGRHVRRLTERIGAELVSRRDEQAQAHRLRKLEARVPNTPDVVVVEVDGGRYPRRGAWGTRSAVA